MELTSSQRFRRIVGGARQVALAAIVVVVAQQEVSWLWRHKARSMSLWWDSVEHRQRRSA